MTSLARDGRGAAFRAPMLASVIYVLALSSAVARGGDPGPDGRGDMPRHGKRGLGFGTLGYAGPGAYPGFSGFGLSFHLGYGYGGYGLGVGSEGGYPFYSGPGYPHEAPPLRRCGKIEPFAYYGGPDYPCRAFSHFFEVPGPLAVNPPVVISGMDRRDLPYASDYGPFSGAIPYPETLFAPYASPAGSAGPPSGARPPQANHLGIDDRSVVEADGRRGLRVASVPAGTAAESAGLRPGDVIHSVNGYLTAERGNLEWIIANATPDRVLKMDVRAVADGRQRTIHVPLR